MRIFFSIFILLSIAVVSVLGFRGSRSVKPPLEIFPDMDRQARYKPQGENAFFGDQRNDRLPPANTVARGNALERFGNAATWRRRLSSAMTSMSMPPRRETVPVK